MSILWEVLSDFLNEKENRIMKDKKRKALIGISCLLMVGTLCGVMGINHKSSTQISSDIKVEGKGIGFKLLVERNFKNGTFEKTIGYSFNPETITDKTVTMEVYYNGAIIDYNGEELSSPGAYKIVLKDKVGNVAEYEFERAFTFNAGAIILFVMGGVLVVLIIVLIIRRRIKQRIM